MSTGMRGANDELRRAAMGAGNTGAPWGTNGPMDVVYDQRPEQFEKNLKLQREDLAVKRQTNDTINAIRQQDANTRAQRAGTYDESVDKKMDEASKLMQKYLNDLGIVDAKGDITKEVAGMNIKSREGIAGGRNQTARDIAAGVQSGQTSRNDADNTAAMARARLQAANSGISETQFAQGLKNKAGEMLARNPEYSRFLGFDEKGNPFIKESEDGTVDISSAAVRQGIVNELYGGRDTRPAQVAPPNIINAPTRSAPIIPGRTEGIEGQTRTSKITGKRSRFTNGQWVEIP
jgi:hypothetical protein